MKKLLLVSLCFLFCSMQIFAQNRTVTGTVTAKDDGGPIPGATIKAPGSPGGVVTGADGKYSITVPATAKSLQFSFIGYTTVNAPITGAVINISLETASKALGEVVVTGSLGRKTSEKAIGYAATHLNAADVSLTNETNFLNGLTGKVPGLQINTDGGGVDPAIRVVLRGNRSINGNNQALIVVDGMPVPNGDISSIDPNTIESYDVLNGGSAGALYGFEASNGVIVITTKKGTADGQPTVNYSNSFQAQQAYLFPKYQTQFGQYGGEPVPFINPIDGSVRYVDYENQQYGPAFDGSTVRLGYPAGSTTGPINMVTYSAQAKDPRKAFYNTGNLEQNNVSINSGDKNNNFYLSAQNINANGIIPNDNNKRSSFTARATKTYGNFKAEFGVTYTNTMTSQAGNDYNGQSIPYALDQFPANLNIKNFSDPTSTFANPSDFYDAYAVNPYWAVYNSRNNTRKDVFLGNLRLTYSPTKWLDVSYSLQDNLGFYQNRQTKAEVDFTAYAASDPEGSGNIPSTYKSTLKIPGTVYDFSAFGDGSGNTPGNGLGGYSRLQQDALLNFHRTFFTDFKANLLVGSTVNHFYQKYITNSGSNELVSGLYNIAYNAGTPTVGEGEATINTFGFYSDLSINYKGWAFIDASVRNDHDSRLAANNRSYSYPGVSGSFVFTDAIPALKGNSYLSYGKLRAAYSQTGQVSDAAYNINNVYAVTTGFPFGGTGGLSLGSTNYTNIVPERISEYEFGTELAFFNNLFSGSATYFKQNSHNQTLGIGTSASTGFTTVLTNVGELQSSGYELALTVRPLTQAKNKVGIEIGANLSNNESKVISLLNNIPQFNIAGGGGNEYAIVGQPYPVIKGTDFNRDALGRVIVSATTGYPSQNATQQILGRTTPEYILGLTFRATYKFMTLSAVADFRTGFVVDNANASSLVFGGASALTTQAGRQRFIYPNSVYANSAGQLVPNTNIEVQDGNYGFWQTSAFSSTTSPYITSAASWKIREISLNFNLNQFIKKQKFVKGLGVTLTGRNLFTWLPKTAIYGDPEQSVDNSNAVGYVSNSAQPSSRFFGGNLQVTF